MIGHGARPGARIRRDSHIHCHKHIHTHTHRLHAHTHRTILTHFHSKPDQHPYLFLNSTLLTSTRLHPNQLPIAIIYSTQEPPQIITNVPSHTTISLPSPRLSLIRSLHHLDLYLLTTNITHITQKSTNTTPQQQIVM